MTSGSILSGLLAAAFFVAFPAVGVAQSSPAAPESTTWYLTTYIDGAERSDVPWYVAADLSLDEGRASGYTSCNELTADYWIDGETLTFGRPSITDVGCDGAPERVQSGYLAALPAVTAWSIETLSAGGRLLHLRGSDGEDVLTFADAMPAPSNADLASIALRLDSQQAEIDRLTRQVDRLRNQQGGASR
jgi:heat shock protein HslJ